MGASTASRLSPSGAGGSYYVNVKAEGEGSLRPKDNINLIEGWGSGGG